MTLRVTRSLDRRRSRSSETWRYHDLISSKLIDLYTQCYLPRKRDLLPLLKTKYDMSRKRPTNLISGTDSSMKAREARLRQREARRMP